MKDTWLPGNANYHRTPAYKEMETAADRAALNDYHNQYPLAVMGDVYRVLNNMETLKSWQDGERARKLAEANAAKEAKRNGKGKTSKKK
jgi:hypothetical protein